MPETFSDWFGALLVWCLLFAIVCLIWAASTPRGGWLNYIKTCPLWHDSSGRKP